MAHYDIEKALYDVEDLLQRVMVPFILLKETARSAKEEEFLAGTAVDIGVRALDLNPSALNTIKSFAFDGGFREAPFGYEYTAHGVPVRITVINNKYKFFENPDIIFYGPTDFRIPNPFSAYWRSQHLVK